MFLDAAIAGVRCVEFLAVLCRDTYAVITEVRAAYDAVAPVVSALTKGRDALTSVMATVNGISDMKERIILCNRAECLAAAEQVVLLRDVLQALRSQYVSLPDARSPRWCRRTEHCSE